MAAVLKAAAKPSTLTSTARPLLPQCIHSQKVGVVVSAGKMMGAVKVRVAEQEWNKKFRKHFPAPRNYLVRDPNSSLVLGDVVRITSGHRTSKAIRHVVTAIVAPFGQPVEDRPPVLTTEELHAQRVKQRLLKDVRSAHKGRQVSKIRLKEAARQGHKIPTLEEAMRGLKMYEQNLKDRGIGMTTEEKHKGQVGQRLAEKQGRMEKGEKVREKVKAEDKVKKARDQQAS